jgi:hypothetical protein
VVERLGIQVLGDLPDFRDCKEARALREIREILVSRGIQGFRDLTVSQESQDLLGMPETQVFRDLTVRLEFRAGLVSKVSQALGMGPRFMVQQEPVN